MTSPNIIILLIVDYHAVIGGGARSRGPRPLRTPLEWTELSITDSVKYTQDREHWTFYICP